MVAAKGGSASSGDPAHPDHNGSRRTHFRFQQHSTGSVHRLTPDSRASAQILEFVEQPEARYLHRSTRRAQGPLSARQQHRPPKPLRLRLGLVVRSLHPLRSTRQARELFSARRQQAKQPHRPRTLTCTILRLIIKPPRLVRDQQPARANRLHLPPRQGAPTLVPGSRISQRALSSCSPNPLQDHCCQCVAAEVRDRSAISRRSYTHLECQLLGLRV